MQHDSPLHRDRPTPHRRRPGGKRTTGPVLRAVIGLTIVIVVSGPAGATGPAPGEQAPPIGVEVLLQAPAGATLIWEGLRDKAVILEFWATWCSPCIAAIPHLNELAGEFAGEPVTFLAVSDENQPLVQKFLEQRTIRGWIGLDTDRSVFDAYGVDGIPVTFLIDGRGTVQAITEPQAVTAEVIRALLRGESVGLRQRPRMRMREWKQAAEQAAGDPLFEVAIRPSGRAEKTMQIRGGQFFLMGSPLSDALASAYGIDPPRIVAEAPLPEGRFDFEITATGSQESLMALLRQAIENTFGLEVRKEEREMKILRLLGPPKEGSALFRNDDGHQGFHHEEKSLDASSLSTRELGRWLELTLGTPVIDETGLPGRYDVHFQWEEDSPGGLEREMEKATGLSLKSDHRRIEVLVVRAKAKK